jgi:P27 family predicted phage terminase small subunit
MTKPPKHLKTQAKALWESVVEDFEIEGPALTVLQACCEAFQRMQEARGAIDRDGALVKNRFGELRPHPALNVERDARAGFLRAWRTLNLETAPPLPPGRPAREGAV